MSACIEHHNHQNNFSQSLPACENEKNIQSGRFSNTLKMWLQRSRQRKHLARLDDHLISDIGYSREQVAKEIAKPFWKK